MTPLEVIRTRLEDYGSGSVQGGVYRVALKDVLDLIIERPTSVCVVDPSAPEIVEALRRGVAVSPLPEGRVVFTPIPTDHFKSMLVEDLNLALKPKEE
mgnify:CR=1 FL=1